MRATSIFSFLLILLFSLSESFSVSAQNTDFKWLSKISSTYTESGGKLMNPLTHSIYPISFGTPVILFAAGKIHKNEKLVQNGYRSGVSLVVALGTSGSLKYIVRRDRPFEKYPNDFVKHTGTDSYSFPSGHSTVAFNTATTLSFMYPKWYIIAPSFLWAGGVAYSRLYLGVHYPSDVLAGALIGSLSAIGTHYFYRYWDKKKTKAEGLKL